MAVGKLAACFVLFRMLLPLALLGATVVRYNGFSFVYLCLLLVLPLMPRPNVQSIRGHTGRYLIAVLVLCCLMLLAQVVFQGWLLVESSPDKPYGTVLANCSRLESSLRQLGLQRLEPNDFGNILRIIIPDLGMFVVSLLVLLLCRKLCTPPEPPPAPPQTPADPTGLDESLLGTTGSQAAPQDPTSPQRLSLISPVKQRLYRHSSTVLRFMGEFLVGLFLCGAGIVWPSGIGATYFLLFLGIGTWWGCYRTLGRRFAVVRVLMLVYSAAHLLLIYLYQFQFFQMALPPGGLVARVVGLTSLVYTDCRKPWMIYISIQAEDAKKYGNVTWPAYVNPAVILLLYYTLACETRHWLTETREEVTHRLTTSSSTSTGAAKRGRRRSNASQNSERQVLAASADATDDRNQSLVDESQRPATYNAIAPTAADTSSLDQTSIAPDLPSYQGGDRGSTAQLDRTMRERSPLESILVYIMKQSYVSALIVMMVWSITYHSWLTFVYLLAACFIWMTPYKRSVCLFVSPVLVCYAEALLVMQFVYGFNLTDAELPTKSPAGYKFKEIGLVRYDYVCLHLGLQVIFTMAFWITLRQHMREVAFRRQDRLNNTMMQLENVSAEQPQTSDVRIASGETPTTADIVDGHDSPNMKALGTWLWEVLTKYWLFVCAIMFLVMAVQEAVIYRIIYMVLFLYFVVSFQITMRWWRISIYAFWWVVIIYSMVVLILIYTYQFDDFPSYWINGTGISEQLLEDIGLEQFGTATLFAKLLTPTSFLIVIMLQVNYFQKPFLAMSDINRYIFEEEPSEQTDGQGPSSAAATGGGAEPPVCSVSTINTPTSETSEKPILRTEARTSTAMNERRPQTPWQEQFVTWCKTAFRWWSKQLDRFSQLIWRCLEVHIIKVIMLVVFLCCLDEVTAINVVLVIFLLLGITIPQLQGVMSHLIQCWAGLVILAKMTYQLRMVPTEFVMSNCSSVINIPPNSSLPYPFNGTIDNAEYIGLDRTGNLAYYMRYYISIVLLLAFEAIIKAHQAQFYMPIMRERPPAGIIFASITRKDADGSLLNCAKYLTNYMFYKFGLEICFVVTMVTMVVRLDAYSVVYGVFLGVLLTLSRGKCYYLWPVYIIILLVLLFLQYLSCLGVPAGLCWDYPWDQIAVLTSNLKIFLFLPDFQDGPDSYKLVADFFQLLCVCLQWRVFYLEHTESGKDYPGGSNADVMDEIKNNPTNPVDDFLSCKDSYLDYIKSGLFQYMFWVTLIMVFIAGTTRISLFCMGYLVGCFFFLWFGHDLLVKPLKNLLRLWGFLLGYNFMVIFAKSCLQLVGCVYLSRLSDSFCWVVQLFSIVCLKAGNYVQDPLPDGEDNAVGVCNLEEDDSGLTWDAICFVFLLIQMRVYKSHYFRHVVDELKIQAKLASRGAELINKNLFTKVESQKKREQDVLDGIKRKMERIKLRQTRLHQKTLMDSDDHYKVIRSGDYYMFDEDSDEETESSDPLESVKDPEDDDDSDTGDGQGKVDPFQPPSSRQRRKSFYDVVQLALIFSQLLVNQPPAHKSEPTKPKPRLYNVVKQVLINKAIKDGPKEALHSFERQRSGGEGGVPGDRSSGSPGFRTPRTSVTLSDSKSPTKSRVSETLAEEDEPSTSSAVTALDQTPSLASPDAPLASESSMSLPVTVSKPSLPGVQGYDNEALIASPEAAEAARRLIAEVDEDQYDIIEGDDIDGESDEEEPLCTRVANHFRLAWVVFGGFLDYLIQILNDISREYRSVSRILAREMEHEKRKMHGEDTTDPVHLAPQDLDTVDTPARTGANISAISGDENARLLSARRPHEIELRVSIPDERFEESIDQLRLAEREFHSRMPRLLQLCIALFDALMSRSEIMCYFTMILNHMVSASLLSLTYPVSVFLWAMLSVPRPTKMYWVTIITYTEAIVVVKFLFQFGFFSWNDGVINPSPFWPPRIIGIEKKDNYAVFDLILLFTLFIHRSVLKKHGLWKDAEDTEKDLERAEKDVASRIGTPAGNTPTTHMALEFSTSSHHLEPSMDPNGSTESPARKKKKKPKEKSILHMVFGPFYEFYQQMTNPMYNAVTDVYALMFLCDFVAFFIIVFGYTSFGPAEAVAGSAETVQSVIQENKVPVPFLIMLLAQFVLIILDRALFLRKNIFGKFVFQILLVALVHVWMFFILPLVTERPFSENVAAQLWYFVKCIYFGLSAYQIRSGYPTRILGNFLTKKYNYINLFLFKGFMAIPFLLELRAVMDWMWTDTTLALTSWLQMEDIYANIFVLKCWRRAENTYPTPRGQKRKAVVKYGMGGLLLFLLIFIIWFPLLLFSLANTVYVANPPIDCTINIKIGTYEPIFGMSAQQDDLEAISPLNFTLLQREYSKNAVATSFLGAYKAEDVFVARINGNSTSVWGISPPSEVSLYNYLNSNVSINILTTISISRKPQEGAVTSETVTNQFTLELGTNKEDREKRSQIAALINGSETQDTVKLSGLFPRNLRVPASESPEEVKSLNTSAGNLVLTLRKEERSQWWELKEERHEEFFRPDSPMILSDFLTIVLYNDRVAPTAFSFFTSYGIIGLYLSFILVGGRFLRMSSTGLVQNILYTHLPCVDRLMRLCKDLYLVRETHEFKLEEELYAKLTFLYRSPETLVRWTRLDEEKEKVD